MLQYFTPDSANKILPEVKNHILTIMKLNASLELLSTIQISYDDEFEQMFNFTKQTKEFHRISQEIYEKIEHLLFLGCIPKDITSGLVDFYARKDGREILLCWKAGEESITHWHEIETGFAGRLPIKEENKKI